MTSGGLAAVSSSAFAALYSAFGKYDVVHIHAEGPAFFAWLPKMFGKRVVVTVHGIDWQREKWKSGLGSKFIHQGEKNAAKYADEVIVLSKGVQDYFKETYGRETHFKDEYKEFSRSFNEKVENIRKAKTEMNRQLDSLNNLDVEHLPWIEDFKSYQNLTSLNRRVLVELVESITVYDKEHIHIQYRFDQEIRNVLEYCNSVPTTETEGSIV